MKHWKIKCNLNGHTLAYFFGLFLCVGAAQAVLLRPVLVCDYLDKAYDTAAKKNSKSDEHVIALGLRDWKLTERTLPDGAVKKGMLFKASDFKIMNEELGLRNMSFVGEPSLDADGALLVTGSVYKSSSIPLKSGVINATWRLKKIYGEKYCREMHGKEKTEIWAMSRTAHRDLVLLCTWKKFEDATDKELDMDRDMWQYQYQPSDALPSYEQCGVNSNLSEDD